jgi:hypothetical protein
MLSYGKGSSTALLPVRFPMKSILGIVLAIVVPSFAQVTINELPSREFGQPLLSFPLTSGAPNLVEGREFNSPSGIAFDYSI